MITALQTELAEVKASKADRSEVRELGASLRRTIIITGVISLAVHIAIQALKAERDKPISTGSQSVTVGAASPVSPQRPHLTTEDVAAREDVSVRTIQDWCQNAIRGDTSARRLIGAELRGKSYIIAADYLVLPPNAALAQESRQE
jgi:hypothetical protein